MQWICEHLMETTENRTFYCVPKVLARMKGQMYGQ